MSSAGIRLVWLISFVAFLGTACQQPARPQAAQPAKGGASTPATEPEEPLPPPPSIAHKQAPGEVKPHPGEAARRPDETKPPPPPSSASQPEEPEPMSQAEQSEEEARRLAEIARLLAERMPKRPTPSWVIFREAFEENKDAACQAEWTGGNRLEVHTDNIKRLTLDLTKLPAGAPRRGPWNLQLDRQGIQITGAHGRVLDLVRSKNGNWTVDHRRDQRQ